MNRRRYGSIFLRKDERHLRNRKGLHASMPSNVQLFEIPWNFPGKNTVVGCIPSLGISPTRGSNPCFLCLLHWQADSLPLCHLGRFVEILIVVWIIILSKRCPNFSGNVYLTYYNFIYFSSTFWKIWTPTDFLEQIITTRDLPPWWKYPVRNSRYKNEALLGSCLDSEFYRSINLSYPLISRACLLWSTLKHLSKTLTFTTIISMEEKIPINLPLLKVLPQWQQFWERGRGLSLHANSIYQETKRPKEEKWLTEDIPWNCLILFRGRRELNISSR